MKAYLRDAACRLMATLDELPEDNMNEAIDILMVSIQEAQVGGGFNCVQGGEQHRFGEIASVQFGEKYVYPWDNLELAYMRKDYQSVDYFDMEDEEWK